MKQLILYVALALIITTGQGANAEHHLSPHRLTSQTTADAWLTLTDVVQSQFSPDGHFLAVRTSTHFRIYDIHQDTPTILIETEADSPHYNESPIAFSPDSQYVSINVPQDYPFHTILVWNLMSGEIVAEITQDFYAISQLMFSPGEPLLLISHQYTNEYLAGELTAWEFDQELVRHSFQPGGSPAIVSVSPDGEWAFLGVYQGLGSGSGSWVTLYNLKTGEVKEPIYESAHLTCSCTIRPTWDMALVQGAMGWQTYFMALPTSEITNIFELPNFSDSDAVWSYDGSLLAMRGNNGRVRILDYNTNGQWSVGVSISPPQQEPTFTFSPAQNILALYDSDDGIELWNANSSELLDVLSLADEAIAFEAFSPNGSLLISTDTDYLGHYYLWDVETGELLHSFESIEGTILWSDVSPDGQMFSIHEVFGGQFWVWRLDE